MRIERIVQKRSCNIMKTYTVRFVDKLEIVENEDGTFGIKTPWLKLNLYKGKEHISHFFDKKILASRLFNFDEKGGFKEIVGYSMSDICTSNEVTKIKIDRKFIWSLQHVFKKPKEYIGDSKRIAECKQRLKASKENLVIIYSITLTKGSYPKEHLVARLVGFNITSSNAPSISFYNFNMQPMTIIKPSNIKKVEPVVSSSTSIERPYISLDNTNGTLQITKSQWAHTMDTTNNTLKYYNKIIELLDNKKSVYYNGIVVNDIVLANHRKTGNSIFIVNEYGDFVKKVTDYTKFTTLAPITI